MWGTTLSLAAGCNLITGADGVQLVAGPVGGSGAANGSGSGSNTSVNANTGVGGTADSGSGNNAPLVAADGVTVTEVKLYQGVERPLMKDGVELNSNIPIVAGRDAFLRVFYAAAGSANGVLRVTFNDGAPIEEAVTLSGSSNQESLASTANVAIPGARISSAKGLRVELLTTTELSSGTNAKASYPPVGFAKLPVQSAGPTVKLVLVPVQYGADGSKRLPDTSEQQVDRFRDTLFRLYPVPSVTVIVKAPVVWNQAVSADGNGWDELLNAIVDYRQQSGAAKDEYYYGIFNAANSFDTFCNAGCVAGLSLLAGPSDVMSRAGIGIGFTGEDAAGTAAHEVGHQHGRPHAPCGVSQSVDPFFPHPDGSIGVWGFDLLSKTLIAPDSPDFMSYCHPEWVSDFNFVKLFERLKLINNAAWQEGPPVVFDRIAIRANGSATWLKPIVHSSAPSGQPTELELTTRSGKQKLTGHFYPYSHLAGGVVLVPKTPFEFDSLSFDWNGHRLQLAH